MKTYLVCTPDELAKYPAEEYGWVVNASSPELAIGDAARDYRPGTKLVATEITDDNQAVYGLK